jgi:hypothetical protein
VQGLPVAYEKLAAEAQSEAVGKQLVEPPAARSPSNLTLGDLSPTDSGLLSPGMFSPFGLPQHVAFEEQDMNHSKKLLHDTQKRASMSSSEPSKRSYCCSTVDDASPFGGSNLSLSFSEDTDCEGVLSTTPKSPSRLNLLNTNRCSPKAKPAENVAPTIFEKQAWCGVRRFDWASAVADTASAEESEEDEECLLPSESELIWERL